MGPARAVKYLLDTHIWHRAINDARRTAQPLSPAMLKVLQDEPEQVALCDISLLELTRHLSDAGGGALAAGRRQFVAESASLLR